MRPPRCNKILPQNLSCSKALIEGNLKRANYLIMGQETFFIVATNPMNNQIKNSVQQVVSGKTPFVLVGKEHVDPPRVVFPGSFNPLHAGHRTIASVAEKIIGGPLFYEISIDNVDKPSLSTADVVRRVNQFDANDTVAITQSVTFNKKAILFPGAIFAVGIDTLKRIGDTRYYDASGEESAEKRMQLAIDQIAHTGCRMLAFGRKIDHVFCNLEDISIPAALRQLCQTVPESLFREDISSSELR